MTIPLTAPQVLDREFLEVRARVLQLAAALDRLERAEGSVSGDPRCKNLQLALAVLQGNEPNRAEQVQLIFSRTYNPAWRKEFGLSNGRG